MVNQKIRTLRIAKNLSTKQVAMVLNISTDAYSAFEQGKSDIGIKQLELLCDFFDISLLQLFGDQDQPKAPSSLGPDRGKKVAGHTGRKPASNAKKSKTSWGKRNNLDYDDAFAGKNDALRKVMEKYPDIPPEQKGFLTLMAQIIADIVIEADEDLASLHENPGGYHPDRKKPCQICGTYGSGKAMWYDDFGYKCTDCQAAINKGAVPKEAAMDHDLFYTDSQLDFHFNLNGTHLKNWIKYGLLKPRIICCGEGRDMHYRIYLLSDHEGFLPPLEMLRIGKAVKEIDEKGLSYYSMGHPWYYFVDPHAYLKDYGIMKYMNFSDGMSDSGSPKDNSGEEIKGQ